jgi:hypothetical protein
MTPPPELPFLDSPEKDALIVALIGRIDALVAENTALRTRVAELEAKLGLPPKTPNNSSMPPSQGRKAPRNIIGCGKRVERIQSRRAAADLVKF